MSGDLGVEGANGFATPCQSDGDGCKTIRRGLVKRQYGYGIHKSIDERMEFSRPYTFSTEAKFGEAYRANKNFRWSMAQQVRYDTSMASQGEADRVCVEHVAGHYAKGFCSLAIFLCFGRGMAPLQAPKQARNVADHLSFVSMMTRRPSFRTVISASERNRHSLGNLTAWLPFFRNNLACGDFM